MKSKTFKGKILTTLLFYNILFLIVTIIFINNIPSLLNYPPNSINTEFERHIDDGFYYNEQSAAIIVLAMIASNATFIFQLRKIRGWESFVNADKIDDEQQKRINRIKKLCYTIPIKLYLFHAFVPVIVVAIGLTLTRC